MNFLVTLIVTAWFAGRAEGSRIAYNTKVAVALDKHLQSRSQEAISESLRKNTTATVLLGMDNSSSDGVNWVFAGGGLSVVLLIGIILACTQPSESENEEEEEDGEGSHGLIASWTKFNTLNGNQSISTVIKENTMPAIAVALVSIPLSAALSIASGCPPMMGIATAVVGGACAGLFGSSAFNIVGPAGALVGLLMKFTTVYGVEVLPWMSLISAVLVLVTLVFRLHEYCLFMPKCVFEGFTAGIALTIGFGQLDFALGLTPGPPWVNHEIELSPLMFKLAATFSALHTIHLGSCVLFLVATGGMLALYRWKATIPWLVPFAFAGVLLGWLLDADGAGLAPGVFQTLRSKYGVASPEFILPFRPLSDIVHAAEANGGSYGDVVSGSAAVAFIAVLETLISAKIAAVHSQMPFSIDRELQGLALSHFACGFAGLMPPTGVFVRANVNRSTGATHKASQFLHALIVLVLAAVGMNIFSFLPLSIVAAVLITASLRMVPTGYIVILFQRCRSSLALLCVVALVSFVVDSAAGLIIGTGVALLISAKETARGHAQLSVNRKGEERDANGCPKMLTIDALALDTQEEALADETGQKKPRQRRVTVAFDRAASVIPPAAKKTKRSSVVFTSMAGDAERLTEDKEVSMEPQLSLRADRVFNYTFLGQLDFLNGEKHIERLHVLLQSRPRAVVLSLQNVPFIDMDGLEALKCAVTLLQKHGVTLYVASARPSVTESLEEEDWYKSIDDEGQVFPDASDALAEAYKAVV